MKYSGRILALLLVLTCGLILVLRHQTTQPFALETVLVQNDPDSPAGNSDTQEQLVWSEPTTASEPAAGLAARGRMEALMRNITSLELRWRGQRLQEELDHLTTEELVVGLDVVLTINGTEDLQERFLTKLGEKDPAAAIGYAQVHHFEAEDRRCMVILSALAEPQNALAWLSQMPSSEAQTQLMAVAVGLWAEKDNQNAFDYATQQPSPEIRARMVAEVVSFTARHEPVTAFEWALQYEPVLADPHLVDLVSCGWATQDFDSAASRILSVPAEDPGRQAALRGLADAAIAQGKEQAFIEIIPLMENDDIRSDYYQKAAQEWVFQKPANPLLQDPKQPSSNQ